MSILVDGRFTTRFCLDQAQLHLLPASTCLLHTFVRVALTLTHGATLLESGSLRALVGILDKSETVHRQEVEFLGGL